MKKFFVPLLIAVMSFTACSSTSNFVDEAVLKIDGQEIMKSEYMVHLYTASTELVSTAGEEAWNMMDNPQMNCWNLIPSTPCKISLPPKNTQTKTALPSLTKKRKRQKPQRNNFLPIQIKKICKKWALMKNN